MKSEQAVRRVVKTFPLPAYFASVPVSLSVKRERNDYDNDYDNDKDKEKDKE